MKKPIKITIEEEAAYIYYTREKWTESVAILAPGIISVDFDANGDVIGIEMIGIDDDTVRIARTYALTRDLDFPTDWKERFAAQRLGGL